jgi:hypothetical protein
MPSGARSEITLPLAVEVKADTRRNTSSINCLWFLMLAILRGLLFPAIAPTMHANPINPAEAMLAIQATVPDADSALLAKLFGLQGGQTLDYSFSTAVDLTSWSARILGILTMPINVTYTGTVADLAAGTFYNWISTGTFGTLSWSGTGRAVLTDNGNTFDMLFSSQLNVGNKSATLGSPTSPVEITGLDDGNTITFIQTTSSPIGYGCCVEFSFEGPVLSPLTPKLVTFGSDLIMGDPGLPGATPLVIDDSHTVVILSSGSLQSDIGTITIIPEPFTTLLVGAGLMRMCLMWNRKHCTRKLAAHRI